MTTIMVSYKQGRTKGAEILNGRSFSFEVSDAVMRALAGKLLGNTLNGLVKGSANRAAMSVEDALALVQRIAAGGKIAKNTRKAQAVNSFLTQPSDILRAAFGFATRDVQETIIAELQRRGETDVPDLPPMRARKAKSAA